MGSVLIENISWLVTMDKKRQVIRNGAVAIEDSRIADIGDCSEVKRRFKGDIVIDGSHKIVLPGLFNCHTHTYQNLLKGLGSEYDLIQWLKRVTNPVRSYLTAEDARLSAELMCLEALKTGTTFLVNHHHMMATEESVNVVIEVMNRWGISGLVARGMKEETPRYVLYGLDPSVFDLSPEQEVKLTADLMQKWNNLNECSVKVCPGPSSMLTSSPELLRHSAEMAVKNKVPLHIHVSECRAELEDSMRVHGFGDVEYLYREGILTPVTQIVHGVWLSEREINLMARTGARLIHSPVSNMYLSSGVAPIPNLLALGVNVALGTDGAASNDNQDMFGVMKTTALLHKVATLNPHSMTYRTVLEMATIGGARACMVDDAKGSLEVGKFADVIVVDAHKPTLAPVHNPEASIVYSALGGDVETVICNGRVVLANNEATAIDQAGLIQRVEKRAANLLAEAGFRIT